MARDIDQIRQDIQALSEAEKCELLRDLWAELDGPADPDVDAAWLAESLRRIQEIENGLVETIPAEEVFRTIEASLEK